MMRRVSLGVLGCVGALALVGCSDAESPVASTAGASVTTTSPVSSPSASTSPGKTSVSGSLGSSSFGSSEAVLPPPYIASATWADTAVGPSLQVAPTNNGRKVASPTAGAKAWAEVLALDPSADTPGMKAQFDFHWTFARLVEPNKPTWNLEPGRPVVSPDEMVRTRCNPGFAEE
ncbi:DUF2599 domain-containing protein [Gordonia sp. (in: high G+C Gram-positive bacteria)]|uniref:DUF2599 domain-containing protein n=1 Tax=Gordonia sp. (in: high G+C Gram-positive bacteria) TaxID=84139 RepID=UPI0025B8C72C|nr:DUF2599 domain-containing protein [Gordonia sp. (in: high G+C Gram-positive bacteria)]